MIHQIEKNDGAAIGAVIGEQAQLTFENLLSAARTRRLKGVDVTINEKFGGISDIVKKDDQFLTDEAWEKVEKKAVFETETVKKAADTFIDTNLKVNGIEAGKVSYTHVVSLLLDYYSKGDRYE